jgi:hypothetical protein
MKPHRATTVLVLGIVSMIITFLPFGIFAWVMGSKDRRAMNDGLMDPAGRDLTNAGRICGIIGTGLFALALVGLAFGTAAYFKMSGTIEGLQNHPRFEQSSTPKFGY